MKTYRKQPWMTWVVASFLLATLIGGCRKDDFVEIVGVCPVVVSTNPANNAVNVPLNQIVTATFNEEMNPATITQASFTLSGDLKSDVPVSGTLTYNNPNATLSFVPTELLIQNKTYTGTVKSSVKDLNGNALQADYVWTFMTGTMGTGPIVIATDPLNNATGVALNKVITATFNIPMAPATLTTATFTLRQGTSSVPGIVTYSGTTASFTPSGNLLVDKTYTATITTGAKSADGFPLAADYVWNFSTGTSGPVPVVISTDPLDDATGVALNKVITATFNMPMDPATLTTATFKLQQGLTSVPGIVTYSGTTSSFTPSGDLLTGTTYTATITTGALSAGGIPLAADYVWNFSTGTSGPIPVVISTDPLDDETGVALNKVITATFNMPMDPATLTTATFTLRQDLTPVPGFVTYSGTTSSFTPSGDLLTGATYTATITTGALSEGGIPLAADYVWNFSTGTSGPVPVVISTDPLDDETGVALNKVITATFNMPMDPTTLTEATFTLQQDLTSVPGIVTYSGTTASFTPDDDLLAGTTYTATITTGALSEGGIPLAADYIWNFSTEAVVVPPVDLGTASAFGSFGGNAGITNQGINTVINGSIGTTAASTLVTGFHDGLTGDIYTETPLNIGLVTNGIFTAPPLPGTPTSEAIAILALLHANDAYLSISPASMPGGIDPGAGELGGLTLAPGIYKSASGTFNISNSDLTLDAQGDPNAAWIFQTEAGLTVGVAGPTGARSVILINGALPKNVFWYVGSAATINGAGGGTMVGTIISTAGVTLSTPGNAVQTVLNGRAISLVASVTMVNTTINVPAP